ncbi:hypothetical protein SAMN05444008_111177 [Cnuella takakiae]|uniref:Uncharacterized protein n=1 Tax=Cnuella takakiae TaxID=1302690 RepID=A0A1M5E292_9BACT|nr:hypothetical protein SAMN05444008_111177 [Cnuella takakiae]
MEHYWDVLITCFNYYYMIRLHYKKGLLLLGVAVLLGVVALEWVLRYKFGFCDAVLTQADKDFEYVAQPNQDRKRFGNRIFTMLFPSAMKLYLPGIQSLWPGLVIPLSTVVPSLIRIVWLQQN